MVREHFSNSRKRKTPTMNGLLVLLILAGSALTAQACNATAIAKCNTDFTSKYATVMTDYSPWITEQQLADLCADADALQDCTEAAIDGCEQDALDAFEHLKKLLNYICSDTSRDILARHATCTASPSLLSESTTCAETFLEQRSTLTDNNAICSVVKTLVKCGLGAVERACSKELSKWYADYIDIALEQFKDLIGCPFSAADVASMATSIASSLVILVAAVVMASMRE